MDVVALIYSRLIIASQCEGIGGVPGTEVLGQWLVWAETQRGMKLPAGFFFSTL